MDLTLIGTLAARDGLITSAPLVKPKASTTKRDDLSIDREIYAKLRAHVQETARRQMRLDEMAQSRDAVARNRFKSVVLQAVRDLDVRVAVTETEALVQKLYDDILGFGPLEKYFFDPDVTEIKILRWDHIRIEKHGREFRVEDRFENEEHARNVVDRMIAPTGRRLDLANPRVNARLFDGSRLIAHIPPVAVEGITATIRRFRKDMTVENLMKRGVMSPEVLEFLKAAVRARMNIIISGGTSSGKTTLLNCLASFIPDEESLITIEDPAELQLQHDNVRRLEARPANLEGQGAVTQRDLMVDALRMAPKRIIIGECRAGETFDMLQAMNTGHAGSMSTAHANSARHCIRRLANMVQMAELDLPYDAIIDQIADAINLIIHVLKDRDGRRRLDHIVEILGVKRSVDGRSVDVELNELWRYDPETGTFVWTAKECRCRETLVRDGGWRCPW
ncbi:putative conjugal transfer proteinc [Moorella thermoacetica]|uniref:Putative conjugal transfer proteinc n=1 Tax=Neomoorella thermoacetica TaxID=1525 RepID=A0A1J5NNA1_NEOTH|nr:putative conjugal transfer proteinc [Moorella thermoacetica]